MAIILFYRSMVITGGVMTVWCTSILYNVGAHVVTGLTPGIDCKTRIKIINVGLAEGATPTLYVRI